MSSKEFRPTFTQLRTFVTIAETGHFRSAAAQLGISQPSLSQALASLEAGLDTQLIERSTRRVIATPVGRSLLPYAKKTVDSLEAFVNQSRGVRTGLVGPMRIGMIPTIAPYLLPDFLQIIPEKAAELEPQIVEGKTESLTEMLRLGKIDVAIIASDERQQGFGSTALYIEEFALVVPENHSLAGQQDVSVHDVEKLDLLLLDEGHCLRNQILSLCRNAGTINTNLNVTRAAGLTTIVQMVAAGMGATLIPMSAVAAECQRPGIGLATIENAHRDASRTVYLAHRSSSARVADYEELGKIIAKSSQEVMIRSHAVVENLTRGAKR